MDIPMDARIVTSITHPGHPMDVHCNGFHWPFPKEPQLQLPLGNCMSPYFTGTFSTYKNDYQCFGTCIWVPKKCCLSTQTSKINSLRQRLQVHIQILDWTTLLTLGQTKNDHFLPPPRGWTSWMDDSNNHPDHMGNCMPRPTRLGTPITHDRICIEFKCK